MGADGENEGDTNPAENCHTKTNEVEEVLKRQWSWVPPQQGDTIQEIELEAEDILSIDVSPATDGTIRDISDTIGLNVEEIRDFRGAAPYIEVKRDSVTESRIGPQENINYDFEVPEDNTYEVVLENTGEETVSEEQEYWNELESVGAGVSFRRSIRDVSLSTKENYEIHVRAVQIDGARPAFEILDPDGQTLTSVEPSERINEVVEVEKEGNYFVQFENEAILTSGTWDYQIWTEYDRQLFGAWEYTIEHQYTEEVEVCE